MVGKKRIRLPQPGTPIDDWQILTHREYGLKLEEYVKEYVDLPFNDGEGPDIPTIPLEVKSRDIKTTSALSIGSMTKKDIIDQSYDQSMIKTKMQNIQVGNHDEVFHRGSEYFDLTHPHIQELLEEDYEYVRNALANGFNGDYLACPNVLHVEKSTNSNNSYRFRISVSKLKKLKKMCASGKMFDRHFA